MPRIQNSLRGLLFKDVALDLTIRAIRMRTFLMIYNEKRRAAGKMAARLFVTQ